MVSVVGQTNERVAAVDAPVARTRWRHGTVPLVGCTVLGAVASMLIGRPFTTGLTLLLLIPAAVADLHTNRLPDRLVAFGAGGWATSFVVEQTVGQRLATSPAVDAAVGLLAVAGPLLVIHLISPPAMGFGDVKFGAVLGAAVGLVDPAAGVLAIAIASAIAAAIGLAGRRATLPFGPPLLVGAVGAALATPMVVAP